MAVKRIYSASRPKMFLLRNKMNKKLKYCVYVLYSLKDELLYIGFTENLKQRLTDHFHGNNQSTKSRKPFILIFCEYYLSKKDATRREKYFKTNQGKKALKLMLRESFQNIKAE